MMLAERSLLYVGGAGSCMGCGEATALRMMLAATGFLYGQENIGIVAATGCNTVYTSTYPYNPYQVSWTNSLFENAPADAMGVRARWDQLGWQNKRLWIIGGDGAMLDIGFQSLSRMLASGMDIKVHRARYAGLLQHRRPGLHQLLQGPGRQDELPRQRDLRARRKTARRLGNICMMHKDVYVAQTTCAHHEPLLQGGDGGQPVPGPAIVNVFTTCQPEHGVGDNMAEHQAKLAADSRSFPVFIYDPRKGSRFKERLSLVGNPERQGRLVRPSEDRRADRLRLLRPHRRPLRQAFRQGRQSSATLLATQQDRLENWHLLQELAGTPANNKRTDKEEVSMIQLDDLAEAAEDLRRRRRGCMPRVCLRPPRRSGGPRYRRRFLSALGIAPPGEPGVPRSVGFRRHQGPPTTRLVCGSTGLHGLTAAR